MLSGGNADSRVVIVGAGHAGGALAALLRQYGHRGPITLVGDEPFVPYQRPPLSKGCLKGEVDAASLALRPLSFYVDNGIEFFPNLKAVKLERAAKRVLLSSCVYSDYDLLIIATGARPIALHVPGADLSGLMYLRTASDADVLRAALGASKRLVIVGGGYIGLEVAASAHALGAAVTVLEREKRVLARVASPALSEFFREYHEQKGVTFQLGVSVLGFQGRDGQVTGAILSDGRVLECDAVLIGVGAIPNDELASDAGLEIVRGVVVDIQGRSSDAAIFAIGDVAHRPLPLYERMFRLESVPNALEQAKQVAAAIMGRPAPAAEVPWFWSDQFDLKLQIAGVPFDVDRTILRGDPSQMRFAVFHLSGDRLQAVEAVNSPAEFMAGKQYILSRKPVSPEKLADPSVSMKEVAA